MPDSSTTPQAGADGRGPAPIAVPPEVPAAADARDKLLAAIGAEAQLVAEKSPGQASAALAQLARAYADVAGSQIPLSLRFNPAADVDRSADGGTTFALIYGLPLLSYSHLASNIEASLGSGK
ncbi:hypothetical protein [Streptomyces lonegramiae]|uniref:Uncharacterized protein n=1 Tax=Streptomyces lonegramiae TaxID=3075524 RepID=A0ABU2XGV4_9ACTN|nr:hypothetical protein [Streptomyces sp. DSM 41529]MDT0544694.1 hypothetical protein [Streptomyces sp. DSM 41529]